MPASPVIPQAQTPDFAAARANMVDCQLRPHRVRDERILGPMGQVPRELFVPPALASLAYIDEDIQVAPGRYLMEPMALGRMLQEAEVKPTDRALVVGAGTGYAAAVLALMASAVTALDSDAKLAALAENNFRQLSLANTRCAQGPLAEGWQAGAPYDVILVDGCVEFLPEALTAQLAEGGRLLTGYRRRAAVEHLGEARIYEKLHGVVSHRAMFNANLRLLAEFTERPAVVF